MWLQCFFSKASLLFYVFHHRLTHLLKFCFHGPTGASVCQRDVQPEQVCEQGQNLIKVSETCRHLLLEELFWPWISHLKDYWKSCLDLEKELLFCEWVKTVRCVRSKESGVAVVGAFQRLYILFIVYVWRAARSGICAEIWYGKWTQTAESSGRGVLPAGCSVCVIALCTELYLCIEFFFPLTFLSLLKDNVQISRLQPHSQRLLC